MENTLIEKQLKAAADLNRIKLLACMKKGRFVYVTLWMY